MPPDELSIIDRYFRPLAGEGAFGLADDAAQLEVPVDSDLVVTTDMLARDTHFLADPPDTVARKALRVNISDLAAKGARPLAYVLSLAVSEDLDETWLAAFAQGLKHDQEHFGIRLLGGDTIFVPRRPVISVTAFGVAPKGRMVHRFGGRAGDLLFVSGVIGAGRAGLALVRSEPGPWDALEVTQREALIRRYRVPQPRPQLARALAELASAAMDISDGLIGDCDKLTDASGCSGRIEVERVPLPHGLKAAEMEPAALECLLTGGDDYEVLAAVPRSRAGDFEQRAAAEGVPVVHIGELTEATNPPEVVFEGRVVPLSRRSFVHGASEEKS